VKRSRALKYISELLDWDTQTAAMEFDWLQMMVDMKFDHYQGYSPGERFYVHFVDWLEQFKTLDERRLAYSFVKHNLVFISQREMHHLVGISYPIIQRRIRVCVAAQSGLKVHQTWLDASASRRIQLAELRTLYVALSDGARIDVFRRENEGVVSNEQVVPSSEITKRKWQDLGAELRKRLHKEGFAGEAANFERICLIDDFTGSGSTLVRKKGEEWKGKLHRFCESTEAYVGAQLTSSPIIHIHHYLGSFAAAGTIDEHIRRYMQERSTPFSFEVTFCHVMPKEVVINDAAEPGLVGLIKSHYDSTVENEHLGKDVAYGYKQCGLPIVLDHNTPNNSIALLWAEGRNREIMRGLFPRKQRHVEHGQSV
jgi:hypothetical protein